MMKRHEVQVLRRAGHSVDDVAELTGVSPRSVKRVAKEPAVANADTKAERTRRKIGRPSSVEAYRQLVEQLVGEKDSEGRPLQSKEILRRIRQKGFDGGKSAVYALVASLRPPDEVRPMVRFEGLPGEFCQHDFGQVDVKFDNGAVKRIRFFASRLKYSRYARVSIVHDEKTETVARSVVQHYDDMGGVPLIGVFDRPTTVVLAWKKDGTVTKWNQTFAEVMLDIGVGVEVCWPARGNQKGSIENLVGWVKGSFFKQRTFIDDEDLLEQLEEWLVEINERTPSRATGVIPIERKREEQPRLRALKVKPDDLVLRFPVLVGPTAYAEFDGNSFMLPAGAVGVPGTAFVHRDRIRFVAGKHSAAYARPPHGVQGEKLDKPYLQAQMVAAVSGKRAKRYLMRQQLLEVGQPALDFITELVHRKPRAWLGEVERLHALLLEHGKEVLFKAFQAAVADDAIGSVAVATRAVKAAAARGDPQHGVLAAAAQQSSSPRLVATVGPRSGEAPHG